jgi:hypothetical protein
MRNPKDTKRLIELLLKREEMNGLSEDEFNELYKLLKEETNQAGKVLEDNL